MAEKTINNLSWKMAGKAGDGILNAGLFMFAKTCQRGGLHVFATDEYPSLVRGGHNHLSIKVSEDEVFSHSKKINILVSLNKESVDKHLANVTEDGAVIFDSDEINHEKEDKRFYPVPLLKLAEEAGGAIMRNTVSIGATMALVDFGLDGLNEVIKEGFRKKGDKVIQGNIKAAKAGYDYIMKHYGNNFRYKLKKLPNKTLFLSGHDAVSIGAIKAGCKFYAAYPMTPATHVMLTLAELERDYNLVMKHVEDEIAAINMAIGASYAGVRAMCGTSGGGFCLMVEGLGLASQTETPVVILESQRPGPATGMATRSGQGDLKFLLTASTDESPRIVIAPGDVEECFYYTIEAFNLAEKYQMPVIILTDKFLGVSYKSVNGFDFNKVKIDRGLVAKEKELGNGFLRYRITDSGISPRSLPGQKGGEHTASSYEHNEEGFENEDPANRIEMHDKRFRKMDMASKEIPQPELFSFGNNPYEITFISWGSTKGPIREAMKLLEKDGIKSSHLHLVFLSPFPAERMKEVLKKAKNPVIVENNKTCQLGSLIKEHALADIKNKILKYDGRAFFPEEIYEGAKKFLRQT